MAIIPTAMRPKRVTQKVKLFPASPFDAGLCLVQSESNPSRDPARPLQRLIRVTAAQNHEVIGIVHDLGLKSLTPPADPPVL
jgi:hypothetical protein